MGVSTDTRPVALPLSERLAEALRISVGLGLPGGMPPKQLARDLDIDVKTVYSWMAGISGIRGEHLVALFERMPALFANIVLSGTGCTVAKLGEARERKQVADREMREALAIATQALADDTALAEIEREIANATESRAVRRGDDARRNKVVSVLAEDSRPRDGMVTNARGAQKVRGA